MADINLIPQEERTNARVEGLQKKLQIYSVGFLILTAIVTIVTLVVFTMFSSKRAQLVSEVEELSASINKFKDREELIVVVKDKASAADKIISTRVEFTEVFDKFASLIPQGVYFTDIRVASGKIVLSGKAKTSADVAGLANSLSSASAAEVVSDVSIDSMSSDVNGTYSFVASAKLIGTSDGEK